MDYFSVCNNFQKYKVVIMVMSMSDFHAVGTIKSVCVCVCAGVCVFILLFMSLLAPQWRLMSWWWISASHITHVCRPTWLHCSHPIERKKGEYLKQRVESLQWRWERLQARGDRREEGLREVIPEGLVEQTLRRIGDLFQKNLQPFDASNSMVHKRNKQTNKASSFIMRYISMHVWIQRLSSLSVSCKSDMKSSLAGGNSTEIACMWLWDHEQRGEEW